MMVINYKKDSIKQRFYLEEDFIISLKTEKVDD